MDNRPFDFTFHYEYHSGSVPPPHYHEYSIDIGPDGSGDFCYRDDDAHADEFVRILTPPDAAVERIYRLMHAAGLCSPAWQPPRTPGALGGPQAWLEVTCGGLCSQTEFDSAALSGPHAVLAEAIRALVPDELWQKVQG